jgi:hypothetical protein
MILALIALFPFVIARAEPDVVSIELTPSSITLNGPTATSSVLVTGKLADGSIIDLTGEAQFQINRKIVAQVLPNKRIRGVVDGTDEIEIAARGKSAYLKVEVTNSRKPRDFHFVNDIEPLFARYSCNSSGCHGKAEGQGGFKLSVFGFDPAADYAALVYEGRGRRVFPAAAAESLLIRKAAGQTAHGGGTRLKPGSDDYTTLRGWITAGMPLGDANAPSVQSLRLEPTERILGMRAKQQLRVVAKFSDGSEADVTPHARFQTNSEALASVNADGLVNTSDAPGEVAVMAAYMGETAVFRAMIPRTEVLLHASAKLPVFNEIDELTDKKLAKLNVQASGVCDDAEFLRRVTLDLTGTLPTTEEVRKFLADTSKDKRSKRVDELLSRPAYADVMAQRWADLLRVDRQALGHQRALSYYQWIRESFAENKPFDQFARKLVAAEGPLAETPQAGFFKSVTKPGEMAAAISQVFLGVRIACAECHHHPFDRWTQTDYAGMVAFFTPVSSRGPVGSELVASIGEAVTKHPRTKETVSAHPLGMESSESTPKGDRRLELAEWMTDSGNPFFARNFVNRIWAQLFGRGFVEPVDDVRATNPPSHPELLDALAKRFIESKYDVKALIRFITASRVYQTSSQPNATNERETQNFSRAYFKRPTAEVLLDMIDQATGVQERFPGQPAGTKAVQLWDSKARHDFLKLFGRPARLSACECERNSEPSTSQVLNLLNSPALQTKLAHPQGVVAKLVRANADDAKLAQELYLNFFSRLPTTEEEKIAVRHLKKADRKAAAEDLAWAMLNSLEFLFNH